MWSTTALLVLLSLGVSTIIAADLSSDAEAQKFLDRVTRSISSKDPAVIAGLFHPGFVFKGCKGIYNKEKVVAMLSHLPAGAKFNSTLKSSEYVKDDQIRYNVEVTGFGEKPLVAEFFLGRGDQQLFGGSIPSCQKERVARAADLNSDAEAQKFLDRVARSISSKDPAVIAGLFHPGFVFTGCRGVYNKEKVVAMLSHLPAGAKFNSTLKSSEFVKDDQIRYTVEVTGFGEKPLVAEFFLGRGDQQLLGGSIPSCSKTRSVRDDAKATVEKFLARITRSIESKDLSIISGLFQPGFVFKGCKGSYDKTKIVGMLMQTPAGTKMDFTLKSAEDQGESIKYLVSFAGPNKVDIVAEFILNKKDQQLESGSIPSCQKKRLARGADLNSDAEAQKFLDRVTRSISSKDPAVIAGLFHPGFVFNGCKGVYNKEKVVAMLSHLPAGAKFNSTLKSSKFVKEDQIKYTVEVTGFGEKPLVAEFFLGRGDQQLLGGSIPSCQKERVARGAYVPTAMEHVEAFMRNAKAVIRRYDSGAVAKLFDEGFTVLGCAGSYDKAASVAQIGRIDTENPFDYELLSANFVPGHSGLVEFTVKIYGIWDNFTAEFLYHIEKGNLISGHYTSCKKEKSSRSSREFARGLY